MVEIHHSTHTPVATPRSPSRFWAFVLAFALIGLFYFIGNAVLGRSAARFQDADAERDAERYKIKKELGEAADKATAGVGWVNKDKGVVRLPIDRAMQLEVDRLKAKKPLTSNVKVETAAAPQPPVSSAPGAPPAPAPAGSPAPAGANPATPAPSAGSPGAQPAPAPGQQQGPGPNNITSPPTPR